MTIKQTNTMKVYLDDVREPTPDGWVRTYTAPETIELLRSGQVSHLSLDYDLGEGNGVGKGSDVTDWIEEQVVTNNFHPPQMVIHSDNPAGIERMRQTIRSIQRRVSRRER